MDSGVTPMSKTSKPSLGFRVFRTLFDNSPPQAYSPSPQPSTSKEHSNSQRSFTNRPPSSVPTYVVVDDSLDNRMRDPGIVEGPVGYERSGEIIMRIPRDRPGLKTITTSRHKISHISSKSSCVSSRSSLDSFNDADSAISTEFESEYDLSRRFYDKEIRPQHAATHPNGAADHDPEEYVDDLDQIVDVDQAAESRALQSLKHEIERLKLENLLLKQGQPMAPPAHSYDSDLSQASSITEASAITEDIADESWIPYAEYHPSNQPTMHTHARFHHHRGNRRAAGGMARMPPGEQHYPGELTPLSYNTEGSIYNAEGSISETVSMVTDGSRESSRQNSGVLQRDDRGSPTPMSDNSGPLTRSTVHSDYQLQRTVRTEHRYESYDARNSNNNSRNYDVDRDFGFDPSRFSVNSLSSNHSGSMNYDDYENRVNSSTTQNQRPPLHQAGTGPSAIHSPAPSFGDDMVDIDTVQQQHQQTLERLMVSQQRRKSLSGTNTPKYPMDDSPERQFPPRSSRHVNDMSISPR